MPNQCNARRSPHRRQLRYWIRRGAATGCATVTPVYGAARRVEKIEELASEGA